MAFPLRSSPTGAVYNHRHSGECRRFRGRNVHPEGPGNGLQSETEDLKPSLIPLMDIGHPPLASLRSLAPPSLCEGEDNTVIETIHHIISSAFTTRLDPHTLQRAFTTHHLTRLDHPSNGPLPFQPLVAVIMSAAVPAFRVNLCVRCRVAPSRHRFASVVGLLCTGLFSHLLAPVSRLDSARRHVSSTTCSNLNSARKARLSLIGIHADHC